MIRPIKKRFLLPAALLLLTAAVFGVAQQQGSNKQNVRPHSSEPAAEPGTIDPAQYIYEFTHPEFFISHIVLQHDDAGRGKITFSRKNEDPVIEPLELSSAANNRIQALWHALRFLDSTESYQSDRNYPHLGTMRLKMENGTRRRTAEFNWTNHSQASLLVAEYRRAVDQAILVFDLAVARESQPLNAPKLMEQFERLLSRNGLSDPKQLVPLLKEISVDEHLPLIARNHAARLLKKIDK